MGLLRLTLALAVVLFHLGIRDIYGIPLMNGGAAVFSFFVISGFYMTMVLRSRYTYEALGPSYVRVFYLSRFLRLYPVYAVVLLGFLVACAWTGVPLPEGLHWPQPASLIEVIKTVMSWASNAMLALINVPSSNRQLVIGPAWSIGVELSFYALAPFAMQWRSSWQWLASAISFALLLVPYGSHAPVLYGFHFFMMGQLAYLVHVQIGGPPQVTPFRTTAMALGVLLLIVAPIPHNLHIGVPSPQTANSLDSLLYALLVAVAVPWLQHYTGKMALDNWVGRLSYPVYLVHMPVIVIGDHLGVTRPLLIIGITLMLSAILLQFENLIVEPLRLKLRTEQNESRRQTNFHDTGSKANR